MCEMNRPIKAKDAAKYLGISTTTLYEWIARGILRQGRHFVQHGHIKLFVNGPRLFNILLRDTLITNKLTPEKQRLGPLRPQQQTTHTASIDREYFEKIGSEWKEEGGVDVNQQTES